jgi:hypothetical protein
MSLRRQKAYLSRERKRSSCGFRNALKLNFICIMSLFHIHGAMSYMQICEKSRDEAKNSFSSVRDDVHLYIVRSRDNFFNASANKKLREIVFNIFTSYRNSRSNLKFKHQRV